MKYSQRLYLGVTTRRLCRAINRGVRNKGSVVFRPRLTGFGKCDIDAGVRQAYGPHFSNAAIRGYTHKTVCMLELIYARQLDSEVNRQPRRSGASEKGTNPGSH
jgi:hypothetical protein